LYESSLSLFFVELNTNASFAGSARCTGKPLFLRSLATYLPDVDCSSDISGFMEECLSTNVFYASSLFSISFLTEQSYSISVIFTIRLCTSIPISIFMIFRRL